MIRFLLYRPIAVLAVYVALVALGGVLLRELPVSLLPDIPVPEITVQVSYPNVAARQLQQVVVEPMRQSLQQVGSLSELNCQAQDGQATLKLRFTYQTDLTYTYLEVNERIDQLMAVLPREVPRPKVLKAGVGDLPVFYLSIFPKHQPSGQSAVSLGQFVEQVIKKRIEQLPEVALADMSGAERAQVVISPRQGQLQALGLSAERLGQILSEHSVELGNVVVQDGQYQYNVRVASGLQSVAQLEQIPIRVGGRVIALKDIAVVRLEAEPQTGSYLYNGRPAIALAIIKQSDTQLLALRESLGKVVAQLEAENPSLAFAVSQDQTQLLELSIDNLLSNLYVGGICAFAVMFLFLNEWKSPILIGISIPITLLITFLFFYLLGISINILSLSGLILGVGMVVDSSIIVIENIIQFRQRGASVADACMEGTSEVMLPLFTSILTNSAVFVPLLLLSGLAGALFADQALSVSIALFVSLGVSFTLVPVLYRLLFEREALVPRVRLGQETRLMRHVQGVYAGAIGLIFRFPRISVLFFGGMLMCSVLIFRSLSKNSMPSITRDECWLTLDWGEAISLKENERRVQWLVAQVKQPLAYSCAFVGQQQFMLSSTAHQQINEAQLVLKVSNSDDFERLTKALPAIVGRQFARASLSIAPAPNVFEQLFNTSKPALIAQLQVQKGQGLPSPQQVRALKALLAQRGVSVDIPPQQNQIQVSILAAPLQYYGVNYEAVYDQLKLIFKQQQLVNLRLSDRSVPVVLNAPARHVEAQLDAATVMSQQGQSIPLRYFLQTQDNQDYKTVYTSTVGPYVPLELKGRPIDQLLEVPALIRQLDPTLVAYLEGSHFDTQQLLRELGWVMLLAVVLLFFILAAQFESLSQPLIVMATVVFALTGSLIMLYLANDSLNIMAGIGMIVLIGVVDNDSILKIDTMNKGLSSMSLRESIETAGKRRLKAQLMTTLTTLIGMLPTLFSTGLGAELQRPLALSVIGGMLLGLFVSNTFIPLIYWYNAKRSPVAVGGAVD